MKLRPPLRLLVPVDAEALPSGLTIQLAGRRWGVVEVPDTGSEAEPPRYVCVSYAHGGERRPHPFDDREVVSTRSIPVIETVLATGKVEALWADAFSVPFEAEARAACLRQMGRIYARAAKVIVVLGSGCGDVLVQAKQGRISEAGLKAVEDDIWVSRAWTYQELANAGNVDFVAEGRPEPPLSAEELLNAVGKTISGLKKAGKVDGFGVRKAYPRLDALEDLIGGWMVGAGDGNAYNTLSCMYGRQSTHPEDAFNAIIGAISPDWEDREEDRAISAVERFMRVCEAKPDFSFIFADADRSDRAGRSWRPVPAGRLDAVLPWHCQGPPLPGTLREDGLDLEGMWRAEPGEMPASLLAELQELLDLPATPANVAALAQLAFGELKKGGFAGKGDFLAFRDGLFFSRGPLPDQSDVVVAVAKGLKLAFGGPALLLHPPDARGRHAVADVGVFVGLVPGEGELLRLA